MIGSWYWMRCERLILGEVQVDSHRSLTTVPNGAVALQIGAMERLNVDKTDIWDYFLGVRRDPALAKSFLQGVAQGQSFFCR